MGHSGQIEVLARGVCVKDGSLLLCRSNGARNTYLPGGHVEFMEAAEVSLVREIQEELGLRAKVGAFLGVIEHTFIQKGEPHCEINLIFEITIPGLSTRVPPVACEDHISFRWIALGGVAQAKLEPSVLRTLLPAWLRSEKSVLRWGTTVKVQK